MPHHAPHSPAPPSAPSVRSAAWYDANADEFFGHTKDLDTSEARTRFMAALADGARVLDAGCGSGRDSLHFLRAGLDVDALDASAGMVRLAREHTGLPVAHADIMDVTPRGDYDGVWAMASLIHLDRAELPRALALLGRCLRPGGVMMVSLRHGRRGFSRRGLAFNALDEAGLAAVLAGQDLLESREVWTRPDDRSDDGQRPPWLFALMTRTAGPADPR